MLSDDNSKSEYKEESKYKECENKPEYYSVKNLSHKSKLYVIAVVSNPARFARRYQLFNEFCKRMKNEPRVELMTIELQQGSRPFITESKIQLRTDYELWYKENLINIE